MTMFTPVAHVPPRRLRRRMVALAALLLILQQVLLGFVALPADSEDTAPGDSTTAAQPAGAVPAFRQANHVAVFTVHETIDRVTLYSLERRLQQALDDGCDAIVIDLDTPGGRMDATLDICNLIKADMPANTVAWVNPKAYSAGTIIALACREIVMDPNSRMGDAAPIQVAPDVGVIPLPAAERAKKESPLLAEVIDSARRSHYDEKLVQSFVSVGVELWMLENANTGQRVFVDRAEYRNIFGNEPPTELTAVAPPEAAQNATPSMRRGVLPWINRRIPDAERELDPEEYQQSIEQAQTLPTVRPQLTADEADQWQLVMQVVADDRLLTLNEDEAVYYGLATTIIADQQQLQNYFGANKITRYDGVWSEGLVRVLTSQPVMWILIVVFIVGLFIELAAPGFGVFGGAALVALALLVGAPYLLGMAQWWDLLLILVGVALVLAELFFIPGVGVAGFGGAVCLLVGLTGVFVSGDFSTSETQSDLVSGAATVLTAMFASAVGIWLISRYVHSIPIFDRLILTSELGERDQPGGMIASMVTPQKPLQNGDIGVAVSELRPGGRADFDGRHVEVRSAGPYIARGSRVRVVNVGPFVIEVEEASS